MKVNYNEIINGTLKKRLINGYETLKESGLSEDSARIYKDIYEKESLSDILEHSEMIFKEPIMGLHFYESILDKKIPLYRIPVELNKVESFYEEYKDKMIEPQRVALEHTLTKLRNLNEGRRHMVAIATTEDTEDIQDAYCNALYNGDTSAYSTFKENMNHSVVSYAYDLYTLPSIDIMKFRRNFSEALQVTEESNRSITAFETLMDSTIVTSYLLEDTITRQELMEYGSIATKMICEHVSNISFKNVLSEIYTESIEVSKTSDVDDIIFQWGEENIVTESIHEEIRVVTNAKAHAVYDTLANIAFCEYVNGDGHIPDIFEFMAFSSMEEIYQELANTVHKLEDNLGYDMYESTEDGIELVTEYTRRGEATPVIRKSVGTLREGIGEAGKKSKPSKSELEDEEDEEEDDEDNTESNDKEKESDSKGNSSEDNNEDDDKSITKNNSEIVKDEKGNPVKPKTKLTTKIQNKAIDADVKMQKKSANMKQGITEIKNAGKAILRLPMNIVNSLKTTIEEWATMDENKRKEKILQPGYRSTIFKKLRTAVIYGSIWHYKKYMVIVAFICKHTILSPLFKANDAKTQRLRNELTHELDTEIKVVEEKINDANSNGDQKQKYQLIRLKEKLVAERTRVATNSKYI